MKFHLPRVGAASLPLLSSLLLLLLLRTPDLVRADPLPAPAPAPAEKKPAPGPTDPECTVTSPHSENFFDLRPLRRLPDLTPAQKDWTAKGQDYGANFTINICAPVLSDTAGADGVAEEARANVSAFYEKEGVVYSIGSVSTTPKFRGRKLVLQYDDGSPCPDAPAYRKSTIMSLMCDREAYSKPTLSFVGQANECAYFFEVRTAAACATVKAQALGPVSVFGIIAAVAAVVYCIGGCVYQRTVMHARGWRQIPHYAAWASMLAFLWNTLHALSTAILRRLPLRSSSSSSSTFRAVPGGAPRGFGRRSSLDDENRLIDELDDEAW